MPIDVELSAHVYEACKLTDSLFVFNPYLPQQNFYSQQLRALALAAEIASRHLKPGHRRVCVIGAGVAGRTIAAAFLSQAASVTIVEKQSVGFHSYLNASHRELHPNIIFWPFQEPTPATALPFMNWAQAPVPEVVEAMLEEWKQAFAKRVTFIEETVDNIDRTQSPLQITLKDSKCTPLYADICVVATGFGAERQFGKLETPPYWSPSSIVESGNEVMVSGSGDGGLIDALSPILGKDVTKAAHIVATRLSRKPVALDVKAVEEERRSKVAAGSKDSADPCAFYSTVHLDQEDADEINHLIKRKPTPMVTLLHESISAYSFSAAPINKLLLSHFSNGPARCVTHLRGSLETIDDRATMVPTAGMPEAIEPPTRFAKVMVRHGAPPAAATILDSADMELLGRLSIEHLDAATLPGYDEGAYRWTRKGVGSAPISMKVLVDSIRRALTMVGRAYDLNVSNIRVLHENILAGTAIKISLPSDDNRKAEGLGLFPLKVGPVIVELGAPDVTRDIDYED